MQNLMIIGIGALALWAWNKRQSATVKKAEAITTLKPTAAQQQVAALGNQLAAIAQKYPDDPTLALAVSQATINAGLVLQGGQGLNTDPGATTFAQQLQAYQAYRAAGGSKDFETLIFYSDWQNWKQLPELSSGHQASGPFSALPVLEPIVQDPNKTPYYEPPADDNPEVVDPFSPDYTGPSYLTDPFMDQGD